MFTGIIEELGILSERNKSREGYQLTFKSKKILKHLNTGSSVSINGCCLTIVKKTSNSFSADVIEETLKKTNLGYLNINDKVNLELPLKMNERLDGHFVLGHVDAAGKIKEIKKLTNSYVFNISYPNKFKKFLIHAGSISVDGISLTIAELNDKTFKVGIIPHTWKETNLHDKKIGSLVNLEFDVLGKYIDRIMELPLRQTEMKKSK